MRRILPALLLAAALPRAASAQEGPPLFPSRDVAVTYRFSGPQPTELRMAWLAAERKMRMDMPGGMGWLIADHRAQRGFMVMEAQRMMMEVPLAQAMKQFGPSASGRAVREGTDRVAGQACNNWRFEDGARRGRACITEDGVMLRASGEADGRQGTMEAVRVDYGAQDASRFRVPAGYQTMQMPNMPGGMPRGR